MAKKHPSFLFQHVVNSHCNDRFVMHLNSPAVLFVVKQKGASIELDVVKNYEGTSTDKLRLLTNRAKDWYVFSHHATPKPMPKKIVGISLKEAYNTMLDERGVYKELEITTGAVANIKRAIREQTKYPSDEVMRIQLQKLNWTIVQHELWVKGK